MGTIFMNAANMGNLYTNNPYCSKNKSKSCSRSKITDKKGKITVKKTMSAQSYMIRLSNAKNPAQVSNIIRCARVEANSIKSISDSNSAYINAKKIANVVAKKGKIKIKRLKKEEALRRQKEIEESANNIKRAEETAKRLHRKKTARKAEENADVANSIEPYKKEEKNIFSSKYTSYTSDTGLMVDLCINEDTNAAISDCVSSVTSVDVSL